MKRQIKRSAVRVYFIELMLEVALLPSLAMIAALLVSRLSDPSAAVGAAALTCLILTAVISGAVMPRLRKEGWLSVASCAALTFAVLLITASLAFSDGAPIGRALLSSFSYVAVFMLAATLVANRGKRRPKRRR